ncbi:MAG: FecR domain-containing protein, partial [Dinghuibacter sp.]|nr:FecR domain-containing protein [Dinghuibacter sp.]
SFNDEIAEPGIPGDETVVGERIRNRLLQTIREKDNVRQLKPRKRLVYAAAAAVLFFTILSVGVYYIFPKNKTGEPQAGTSPTNTPADIAPGGNRALLTLADGTTIVLDSAANGTITQQGGIQVKKLNNGQLAYTVNGNAVTEKGATAYNTITTPRGGQYQVTLADGTQVWLNAASSLRFPVLFNSKERKVEMTGEAYFEVAKNSTQPFRVMAPGSEVEVLGTHFNINAYPDETQVKTTLLEGRVQVAATGNNTMRRQLVPGQQSAISASGNIAVQNNADTEEAVAWKNGRFQFSSADLKTILRQIARWYDVEVEYRGNVQLHFTGQLTRNENVSKVFEKLALTGEVQFSINGRKIIVSPAK